MARDSYNQSLGNPLQRDRLPKTRPTIELLCRRPTQFEAIGIVLCWALCLFAASLCAWLAIREQQALPLPLPPLLLIVLSIVAITVLVGDEKLSTPQLRLTFLVIGLMCVVMGMLPPVAWQLLAAVAISVFTRTFGQHYVGICTASPMRRATAMKLRTRYDSLLRLIATWPILAFCLNQFSQSVWFVIVATCVIPAIAAAFVARESPSDIVTAPCEAFGDWCCYNLRNETAPGLYIGPSGSWLRRLVLTAVCVFLVSGSVSPATWHGWRVLLSGSQQRSAVADSDSPDTLPSRQPLLLAAVSTPTFLTLALPMICCWPLLVSVQRERKQLPAGRAWVDLIADLRRSPDPIEASSLFMAKVAADGSPVLTPRAVAANHIHFLGDSGAGKTSLGLAPTIEQLIGFGDSSFVVVDLKGDSLELLATMKAAAAHVAEVTGQTLPIKHFTTRVGASTYGFNPMVQPFWADLDPIVKTDILCAAFGLNYGTDYGAGFYTSANAEVLYQAVSTNPEARSFAELAETLEELRSAKGPNKLDRDVRSAGLHVQMVLKRLALVEALNVTPQSAPAEVVDSSINLMSLFERPQLVFFQLPCTLSPGVAPEIARNAIYSLLCGATLTATRRCQVYLVIDEFQRIVANNLEYLLQLARSMNVGVILANQSMEDLRTSSTDLVPALEANCRMRQWFSVSSSEDRRRIIANAGEVLEEFEAHTYSERGVSLNISTKLNPRLSLNDVLLASDHSKQSILTITRGAGYAQYGGFSLLVETDYHVSADEYDRRRAIAWPAPGAGAFVPAHWKQRNPAPNVAPRSGPIVTTEFFGQPPANLPRTDPPRAVPRPKPSRGRKPKKSDDSSQGSSSP